MAGGRHGVMLLSLPFDGDHAGRLKEISARKGRRGVLTRPSQPIIGCAKVV